MSLDTPMVDPFTEPKAMGKFCAGAAGRCVNLVEVGDLCPRCVEHAEVAGTGWTAEIAEQEHMRILLRERWRQDARQATTRPAGDSASPLVVEALPRFLARVGAAPDVAWHVPGLVPVEGTCLWHGQPRDFKSWCAVDTGLALARGGVAFASPRFKVAASVRVAYITEEDPERLVAARLSMLTSRPGVPTGFYPVIRKGLSFDSPQGQAAILQVLAQCNPAVVIFDPLRGFTANSDKGPADLRPVVEFLRHLQNTTTAKSVLLIHHDTKPLAMEDARNRSQQASGGGIFSVSDCPVGFKKLAWDKVAVFPEDYKLGGDPTPFEVTFATAAVRDNEGRPHFGPWVIPTAETKEEHQITQDANQDKVGAWLQTNLGLHSTDDVRAGVKGTRETIGPALEALRTRGLVLMVTGAEAQAQGRNVRARLWTWVGRESGSDDGEV